MGTRGQAGIVELMLHRAVTKTATRRYLLLRSVCFIFTTVLGRAAPFALSPCGCCKDKGMLCLTGGGGGGSGRPD